MKILTGRLLLLLISSLICQQAALATDAPGRGYDKGLFNAMAYRHHDHHRGAGRNRIRPPAGYSGFMTFLENGRFDPRAPNPEVPGCFGFNCSGDYFHVEVIGRSLAQVSALELDAKLFFILRFGVDVDDPANAGKMFLRRYYRDPRANLNAYLVSRRSVPTTGWQVDDGGWQLIFLEDFALGGDFTGETAPAGTTLTWGEYLITPSGPRGGMPFFLSHRSSIVPLTRFSDDGSVIAFQREVFRGALDDPANDWANPSFPGQGLDQGIEFDAFGLGGEVTANARHVLTFSEAGGL